MGAKENTEKTVEVRANMHKPCGGAVEDPLWYVAVVRPRYERICKEKIEALGYEAYVASQKSVHVYASRNKREVETIVIPKTVFVQLRSENDRLEILKSCLYIDRFLINKSSKNRSFAVIPDAQIRKLKFMLYESDCPVAFTSTPLRLGDKVQVLRGPLAGLEGSICRMGGNSYIAIEISELGYAMATIPSSEVEKLTK